MFKYNFPVILKYFLKPVFTFHSTQLDVLCRFFPLVIKKNLKLGYTCVVALIFLCLNSQVLMGQLYTQKQESYFGLQIRPIIPLSLVGDKPFTLRNEEFSTKISPIFSYSYGGIVRIGLTDLLAIETGMNYTKRRYSLGYVVADSNLSTRDEIGFVSFDVPINLLVYVKLNEQFYMNVSTGVSVNYNPSNIWSPHTPDEFKKDVFIFKGRRNHLLDFNANAEVGFEYRMETSGIIYFGIAGKIPFTHMIDISTEYRHDAYYLTNYGLINGATFAACVKYFFHNVKRKSGIQRVKGPIE